MVCTRVGARLVVFLEMHLYGVWALSGLLARFRTCYMPVMWHVTWHITLWWWCHAVMPVWSGACAGSRSNDVAVRGFGWGVRDRVLSLKQHLNARSLAGS
jgi:hypothetical protein